MPSAWLSKRVTKSGEVRWRVNYRIGGRESVPQFAGSFKTQREALARKAWVLGELAAMRVPDVDILTSPPKSKTVADAIAEWRDSRVDVTEGTRGLHRIALNRVLPVLGTISIAELTSTDVARLVEALAWRALESSPANRRASLVQVT